jgi:hypothetical protein
MVFWMRDLDRQRIDETILSGQIRALDLPIVQLDTCTAPMSCDTQRQLATTLIRIQRGLEHSNTKLLQVVNDVQSLI